MFGDTSNLPVGSGILLSALLYGAISLTITGPTVAERTIERGEWKSQCRAHLTQSLIAEQKADESTSIVVPNFDCDSLLGMFGGEGRQVCRRYGNPSFKLPGMDQLEARQRQARELRRRRLELATAETASRCDCAVSLTLEKARVPFALYAGSARLIEPSSVRNLTSELKTSLRSPICAAQN